MGRNAAALLEHIGRGNGWVRKTVKEFSDIFVGISEQQVRRALSKLENAGLVESKVINPSWFDNTKSYIITPYGRAVLGEPIEEPEETPVKYGRSPDQTSEELLRKAYNLYESIKNGVLSSYELTNLSMLCEQYGEWVLEALEIMGSKGKCNIAYCKAILERWRSDGKDKPDNPEQELEKALQLMHQNREG